MTRLSLDAANTIVAVALRHATQQGMRPMSIAVLDAGGHLLSFQRQDGSGLLRPQIASGKAWGALGMGVGSRELAKRAQTHPVFFGALVEAAQGRIFPVAGGVLVRDAAGEVIGAVGASGDLPEQDEACALAGIAEAGLVGDPGG